MAIALLTRCHRLAGAKDEITAPIFIQGVLHKGVASYGSGEDCYRRTIESGLAQGRPVRPGLSLHKSQSCYPFYLTTQTKNEFGLSVSVEKDRGY